MTDTDFLNVDPAKVTSLQKRRRLHIFEHRLCKRNDSHAGLIIDHAKMTLVTHFWASTLQKSRLLHTSEHRPSKNYLTITHFWQRPANAIAVIYFWTLILQKVRPLHNYFTITHFWALSQSDDNYTIWCVSLQKVMKLIHFRTTHLRQNAHASRLNHVPFLSRDGGFRNARASTGNGVAAGGAKHLANKTNQGDCAGVGMQDCYLRPVCDTAVRQKMTELLLVWMAELQTKLRKLPNAGYCGN